MVNKKCYITKQKIWRALREDLPLAFLINRRLLSCISGVEMKGVVPIKGHPGYYISKEGKVYNKKTGIGIPRELWGKYRELKPNIVNGYKRITFCRNNKIKSVPLHRLLLTTFVEKRPEGMESRHLDGNKLNNNLSNLRWGTRLENGKDRVTHGTSLQGKKNPNAKLKEQDVIKIREMVKNNWKKNGSRGGRCKEIAKMFGVSVSSICRIVKEERWKT